MWANEDALPEDIDGQLYSFLFPTSVVIDGCRTFPWPAAKLGSLQYQPDPRYNPDLAPLTAERDALRREVEGLRANDGITGNKGLGAVTWKQRACELHARAEELGDRIDQITAERDAALARCAEMESLLREARPLVCSIAADDHNDYWQHAADVTKGIDAVLGQGESP